MFYTKIKTPQNVYIKYPLAGLGKRIPASIIDILIVVGYWYFMYAVFYQVLEKKYDYFGMDNEEYEKIRNYNRNLTVVFILITLPSYIYHFLCENFMDGQSFGKRVMKIKVVKLDGTQPDFHAIAIRSAFRLVDVYFMGGILGIFSIILGKKGQRLGDLAAGTTVISLSDKVTLDSISWDDEKVNEKHETIFENITLLTDKDIDLIIKALESKTDLDNDILMKLALKIKQKISYPEDIKKPEEFLSRVVESYKKADFKEEIL
jgi:uncharacterized RDD family membrane protein YckC